MTLSIRLTEEEVKAQVVLPWLKNLGFDPLSLRLETSFTLRVGRHILESPKKDPNRVGARLDILVKDVGGSKNLFIIETKEEDHALTDDDRDQAVSYARLVTPIAPFAIVTNGNDWRIYNVLDKTNVSSSKLSPNSQFEVSLPDDAVADAVEHFLGYSEANLRAFCQAQRTQSLSPLKGSPATLEKKFIPELHVPNQDLDKEFASFTESSLPGLAIIGQSGSGKTCEMCFLDQRSANQGIATLFFQGLLLESGIAASMAADFNWTFSQQQTEISLLKRLIRLLKNRQLIIFVDGIDEWTFSQKVQNLASLLKNLQGSPIKIVVSCKTHSWEQFLSIKGTDTGLRPFLFSSKKNGDAREERAYQLTGFDELRFSAAIKQYKTVFQVDAHFEHAVLEEAKRNPFLLRVFFYVAHSKQLKDLAFSSAAFFNEYYDLMLEKTGNSELSGRQLARIAVALYRRNRDWCAIDVLTEDIGLAPNGQILPSLFETNLLAKSSDLPPKIGFHFQQLRDFIIFKTLRWDQMTIPEFKTAVADVAKDGVQAEALTLFYRHASEDKKRVLDGIPRVNAERYLDAYSQFALNDFPVLGRLILKDSHTSIGFLGQFDVSKGKIDGYGVRSIEGNDSKIELIDSGSLSFESAFSRYGVKKLRWSTEVNGFTGFPGKEMAFREAAGDVRDLIKNKKLSEGNCRWLTKENLIKELVSKSIIFKDFLEKPSVLPQNTRIRRLKLPLALAAISETARRFHLQVHFRGEIIAKENPRQDASSDSRGAFADFSLSEKEEIELRVDEALAGQLNLGSEAHMIELEKAIKQYAGELAPEDKLDQLWTERSDIFQALRSEPSVGIRLLYDHARELFVRFLEEYPKMVDANFPGVAGASFRSHFPLSVIVALDELCILRGIQRDFFMEGATGLYFGSFEAEEPQVLICKHDEISGNFPNFLVSGLSFRAVRTSGFEIFRYLFSTENDYSSFGLIKCVLPLHDFLYKFLEEDFDAAVRSAAKVGL